MSYFELRKHGSIRCLSLDRTGLRLYYKEILIYLLEESAMGNPSILLKALANDTRWQMLELLKHRPLCVNALVCHLKVSQPAVSQHLKILEHAGLVRGEKEGVQVHYELVSERLDECIAPLRDLMSTK